MAKCTFENGKFVARCGDNVVATDTTETGLREQLDDLGIESDILDLLGEYE